MIKIRGWGALAACLAFLAILCASASLAGQPSARAQSILKVQIRRDTSGGMPYGGSHSAGISSIVSGYTTPGASVTVTLSHPGDPAVVRTTLADQGGSFAVALDRLIADGDSVQVADGSNTRVVQVPALSYRADPASRLIAGSGPANISTTSPGAPHSLAISFGSAARQVTTGPAGGYLADFSASPFMPGALGSLHYITPAGDDIYKPLLAVDPLARGVAGDGWADIILGQPSFAQTTFNQVVGSKIFNPAGVYVDRSAQPNRVYVYDAGNSRILGLGALGTTSANQPCTSYSDYGQPCAIQPNRPADVVLGQTSAGSSTCNGDSAFQLYPDVPMADATTLCGMREEQMSLSEGGSGVTMATDAQGNLYVPDFFNNRILRYDSPFTTDTTADYVWGQADFSGMTCNRGGSFYRPSASSLCLAPPPGVGDLMAGAALDGAGNLWVTDTQNNRVLRFPYSAAQGLPATTADLVLGQPSFGDSLASSALDRMDKPASVRVSAAGVVYVADSLNNRVLAFAPPLQSGMAATRLLGSGLSNPRGLEIDPSGGVWVDDSGHQRFVRYVGEVQQEAVPASEGRAWGGLGVDRDGSLMWAGWDLQEVLHFSKPAGAQAYSQDATFLQSEDHGLFNQTGQRGLYGGMGLEVTASQLIYGDASRMVFWNNPQSLSSGQPADGVIGEPGFQTRKRWGPWFHRMRDDGQGRLWVLHGDLNSAGVYGYQLPLTSGAAPAYTLSSPLPVKGGGSLSWTWTLLLGGIDTQPGCGECLWLSDEESHRAFRVRNITTQPIVDIVLGQRDLSGNQCNQGRGRDNPSADSLCHPGALTFDPAGNLFLSDHNTEFDGNLRLLEYDAAALPLAPATALFGIPATHVLGRGGSFTAPNCPTFAQDPLCGPWEPAFDGQGHMALGFNGYLGPRFPMIYKDPLANPLPVAALGDFGSMPTSSRYDAAGRLYVLDHNRSRILIYLPGEADPSPTATPTASATATRTATATPTRTATATPTATNLATTTTTATRTATATPIATSAATATASATHTATATSLATATPTATHLATATPTPIDSQTRVYLSAIIR